MRNQQKSRLLKDENMVFSFGVGGGSHGTLSHLSTVCAIVNGFTGTAATGDVVWPGITLQNE